MSNNGIGDNNLSQATDQDNSVLSDNSNGHSDQPVVQDQENNSEDNQNFESDPLELKREEIKIRVENGANINGAAGSTQEFLVGLGYDVVEIDTADAPIPDTIFRFKPGKTTFLDAVVEDTNEKIPSQVVEETLDEREEYDLLIILGSNITL
jgi:hypothetical protein